MADLHLRLTDEQLAALRAAAERDGAASPEEYAAGIVAERLAEYGVDGAQDEWDIESLTPEERARLDALIEEGLQSPTVPYEPGMFAAIFRRVTGTDPSNA